MSQVKDELKKVIQGETLPQKVRNAIKTRYLGQGKDLSSKEVYQKIIDELSTEFGVDTSVVRTQLYAVAKEKTTPTVAGTAQKSVGQATAKMTLRPKSAEVRITPSGEVAPIPGVEKPFDFDREWTIRLVKNTLKQFSWMECEAVEKAWGVKVERPPDELFLETAECWADVFEKYEVEVPNQLILLSAVGGSAHIFLLPPMVAYGEFRKKHAAEAPKKTEEAGQKEIQELMQRSSEPGGISR